MVEPMSGSDVHQLHSRRLIFCNRCQGDTNHVCQAEHLSEIHYEYEWEDRWYRVWVCAGCEAATFEVSTTNSGMASEQGGYDYSSEYHPKRGEQDIEAKSFLKLPARLRSIYRETIEAHNNGMHILCAAGLRALLEGICDNQGVQGRSLEQKIDALKTVLPLSIVTNLHSFRFIGNSALHELTPPTQPSLALAIEISEDLLNFLYELDYKARRLTKSRKTGSTLPEPPGDSSEGFDAA